jgi:hypothetical protein
VSGQYFQDSYGSNEREVTKFGPIEIKKRRKPSQHKDSEI